MNRTVLVFALSLPAAAVSAQEHAPDTARVAPVVVTATRVPLSQRALPVAVTVISGEELRLRGVTSVAEALSDVTSAYVAQSGSPGATTSLFLRGGESKYVKVLVDGVPANDPGGTYDFASLTTDNLERIEIVRGPASVIHGADAVTGVVHVITRRGAGAPRAEIEARAGIAGRDRTGAADPGTVRSYHAGASTTGALPSGSYSVGVARHQSSGLYELNNHYQNNTFSGHASFSPASTTELRLSLRYTDYQFNYPTTGGGDVADSNAYRTEDRTILGLDVERRLAPSARAVLALSSSMNDGGTDDALDQPGGNSFVSQDKIRRRGAELRVHLMESTRGALTLGAQIEQQDQRSQAQGQFGAFPFSSVFRGARRSAGGYSEVVLTPTARFTMTVGGRFDDNERFGAFGTARAGLSWRAIAGTRLRASAGTAFREPTFFENYSTGFVTGNPALRPERSRSLDVGLDQDLFGDRAAVSVTGFSQQFRDMIDYEPSAAACGYSYCNIAEARSNGIEADVSGRWGKGGAFEGRAGATLLRTRVVNPGFDQTSGGLYRRGESLIRRPGRKWNAEIAYRGTGRLTASARVTGVGARADRDFRPFPATPVTLAAYERVDLGAQYVLRESVARPAITLRVENLTDERYQSVFNFLAPRRTVWLGLRSTF